MFAAHIGCCPYYRHYLSRICGHRAARIYRSSPGSSRSGEVIRLCSGPLDYRTRLGDIQSDAVNPRNPDNPRRSRNESPDLLRGWRVIAMYLGMPISTAQRWAKSGMPVTRSGRNVVASRSRLELWLNRESGIHRPAQLPDNKPNLIDQPKDSVTQANRHRIHRVK